MSDITWIRSRECQTHLQRCSKSLRKLADEGLLEPGRHFIKGHYKTSPTIWAKEPILERLAEIQYRPEPPRPEVN